MCKKYYRVWHCVHKDEDGNRYRPVTLEEERTKPCSNPRGKDCVNKKPEEASKPCRGCRARGNNSRKPVRITDRPVIVNRYDNQRRVDRYPDEELDVPPDEQPEEEGDHQRFYVDANGHPVNGGLGLRGGGISFGDRKRRRNGSSCVIS